MDDNILDILLVDGQRGWPSLDQRLLLLNVVGSKPLHFASPEQDIPCSVAKRSIARQTSSCVIFLSPLVFAGTARWPPGGTASDIDFIPHAPRGQQGRFPIFSQKTTLKYIQKIILTKILDKSHKMYYISIRQRGNTPATGWKPHGVQGFRLPPTFSLLWTLGPKFGLECPISFSPFLPFGAFGNTAGKPAAFFYIFFNSGIYLSIISS